MVYANIQAILGVGLKTGFLREVSSNMSYKIHCTTYYFAMLRHLPFVLVNRLDVSVTSFRSTLFGSNLSIDMCSLSISRLLCLVCVRASW